MNFRTRIHGRAWLALLLAALLGASMVQAAHVHADHGQSQECLQCKLDNGQALLAEPVRAQVLAASPAGTVLLPAAAPVAEFYRLPARGPPTFPV